MKIILEFIETDENILFEDIHEDLLIYNLKNIIQSRSSFRQDSIDLFTSKDIKMQDNQTLKNYKIKENERIKVKIEKNYTNILVEIFQKDLDKLKINLSVSTSIYMIKKILEIKTKINFDEQVLYMDKRILQDTETIADIHFPYQTDKDTKSKSFDGSIDYTDTSSPRLLKLKLITKQSKSKFKLGLDFSFNYLKSLKKVDWDDSAPTNREITDGLFLICYCQNKECEIFNQMFVHNLGKL